MLMERGMQGRSFTRKAALNRIKTAFIIVIKLQDLHLCDHNFLSIAVSGIDFDRNGIGSFQVN